MRAWAGLTLVAGLVLCVAGCGSGGEDVDAMEANAALVQQRTDVRTAAADLLRGAEAGLTGRVASSSGTYRGCESAFNDEFRNFRYEASGRIDAGPDAGRPYLDSLGATLEAAGFSVRGETNRPGGTVLTGLKGGVSASFSELPDQGDYVLLTVRGPCVDVPEDQRDDWVRKDEPTPEIL